MPDKFHVDSNGPYYPLVGGMYGGMSEKEAMALEPRVRCPNCGTPVVQLADIVRERYRLPSDLDDGIPEMVYSVEPCHCSVSVEWAGCFGREVQSRIRGSAPQPVVGLTPDECQLRYKTLSAAMNDLLLGACDPNSKDRRANQYRLIVVLDRILRLVPGSAYRLLRLDLLPEVAEWADKYNLPKPLGTNESTPNDSSLGYGNKYPMPKVYVPAAQATSPRDGFFRRILPSVPVAAESQLQPVPGPVLDPGAPADNVRRRVTTTAPGDLE